MLLGPMFVDLMCRWKTVPAKRRVLSGKKKRSKGCVDVPFQLSVYSVLCEEYTWVKHWSFIHVRLETATHERSSSVHMLVAHVAVFQYFML